MTRVFLVDDHEVVRRGVADLLDAYPDLEVVGESGTASATLGRVAATAPDVVVLDVKLPDGDGIELCRAIRSQHPEIRCLMFTAFDDDEATYAAVLAGASGYVLKDVHGPSLVDAVRRVAAGASLLSSSIVRRVKAALDQPPVEDLDRDLPQLTRRERQILALITEGLTNRQIGDRLQIREKTVKNYVSGLLAKLGMDRRTQAAVYGAVHPEAGRPPEST